jgi:hypothetical protein
MYLVCNSRIHVITLYSGHVCVYYASVLRCWHLVWILVRTDHPYLGVGCYNHVVVIGPLNSNCGLINGTWLKWRSGGATRGKGRQLVEKVGEWVCGKSAPSRL